jgi:hypothetical protein
LDLTPPTTFRRPSSPATSHAPTSIRFRSALDVPVQISGLEQPNPICGLAKASKKKKKMFVFLLTRDRPTAALPLPLASRRPSSFPTNIAATTSDLLLTNALETAKLIQSIQLLLRKLLNLNHPPSPPPQVKKHPEMPSATHTPGCSQRYLNLDCQIWYIPDPRLSLSSIFAIPHTHLPNMRVATSAGGLNAMVYLAASWDMAAPHCDFSFVVLDPSIYLPNLAG